MGTPESCAACGDLDDGDGNLQEVLMCPACRMKIAKFLNAPKLKKLEQSFPPNCEMEDEIKEFLEEAVDGWEDIIVKDDHLFIKLTMGRESDLILKIATWKADEISWSDDYYLDIWWD